MLNITEMFKHTEYFVKEVIVIVLRVYIKLPYKIFHSIDIIHISIRMNKIYRVIL